MTPLSITSAPGTILIEFQSVTTITNKDSPSRMRPRVTKKSFYHWQEMTGRSSLCAMEFRQCNGPRYELIAHLVQSGGGTSFYAACGLFSSYLSSPSKEGPKMPGFRIVTESFGVKLDPCRRANFFWNE